MTKLRIKKREKTYVMMDKTCLEDTKISWGAKGLYTYLVNFPENIEYLDILRFSKDDQLSTKAYIKELKEAGHLIVENKND